MSNPFTGLFKPKAERAQEKADKETAKLRAATEEAEKINQAALQSTAAKNATAAQDELEYKRKIRKIRGSLDDMETSIKSDLIIALGDVQEISSKPTPNMSDLAKARAYMKNVFFQLVTVKRAQKTLIEVERNHQFQKGMNELSNTFKLMNQVNSNSSVIKRLLFLYRYGKVQRMDTQSYAQIKKYFGGKAEQEIDPNELAKFEHMNPVDLMISDELFNELVDIAQVDACVENTNIVLNTPDEIAESVSSINQEAIRNGDAPLVDGIDDKNVMSPDEIDKFTRGL